jgi:hypothetical protein
MKKSLKILIGVFLVIGIFGYSGADSEDKKWGETNYEELKIKLEDGTDTPVAFFYGEGKQAVVFVPGNDARKESYYFLAKHLQKMKIASLSLDKWDEYAILSAIDFLKKKGFEKISFVGGSIGAGNLFITIKYTIKGTQRNIIDKVIVISPYGGTALKSNKIKKLFIAAKEDRWSSYSSIQNLYKDTSEPKILKVYGGSDHAEQLFDSRHREDIIKLIPEFCTKISSTNSTRLIYHN